MRKRSMYVVFFYDPKSSNKKGSYMPNGLFEFFNYTTVFTKDSCYNSKNEAKRRISKLLRERQLTGGRLRPDINRKHFAIKRVYQGNALSNAYFLNKEDVV